MYDPLHDKSPGCGEAYPDSYWASTSGDAPENDGILLQDIDVDVAIIGAGPAGLAAREVLNEKGIANIIPSNLSKSPPCPGNKLPVSLIFAILFKYEIIKSPN